MADVSVPGSAGSNGTPASTQGGAGGDATTGGPGYATNPGSTSDVANTAEGTGGRGGTGGAGGSNNSGAGGRGGMAGAGGNASASTKTTVLSASASSATSTARGGAGGGGGLPGAGTPNGAGRAGGAGGTATATSYTKNPSLNSSSYAKAISLAYGGAGGPAYGAGVAGGAAGIASGSTAYASGNSAYAKVKQVGGAGGAGSPGTGNNSAAVGAGGAAGADSYLKNAVSGKTKGRALTLEQYAYGGAGGYAKGGAAGAGGGAQSYLTATDTTGASQFKLYSKATGGAAGFARAASATDTAASGSAGGAATVSISANGSNTFIASGLAQGGSGSSIGTSTLDYATGSGGAGGAATVLGVSAIASSSNANVSASGDAIGGAGGAGRGAGNSGGAGGVASVASVQALFAQSASATAMQTGGAGGSGANGADGGAGADSTLTDAVSGSQSHPGNGTVSLTQFATGGAGGASDGAAGGAGGAANSGLYFYAPTGSAYFLRGHSYAAGGAGGAGSSAGAGGNATATIDLVGGDYTAAAAQASAGIGGAGAASGTATVIATANEPDPEPGLPELVTTAQGDAGGTETALAISAGAGPSGGPPSVPGFNYAQNVYADAVAGPTGVNAYVAATMGANSTVLATGTQTYADTLAMTVKLIGSNGPGSFGIVLKQYASTGTGFDSLSLTASYSVAGGPSQQFIDFSTTSLATAQAFFTNTLAGQIPFTSLPQQTSNVAVTITLDETLSSGEGFSGLLLAEQVPCFAAGTRIATTRGAIKVEALREGDVVLTRDGTQPVVWLGHRRIDLARHPRPEQARPIKIRRHAFGDGAPSRDLLISPDHAIFHDGVLIPAKFLVNGSTVIQTRPRSITYFHIELPRHDIILAENLLAESYLDTGNRGLFTNAQTPFTLHPAFAIQRWDGTCAPMVLDGEKLAAVRAHLLARAEILGHATTDSPDLHLLADGRRTPVQTMPDGTLWLAIPAGARSLALVSRTAIPAEVQPASTDQRRLGVCIARIEMISATGRYDIPLTGPALTTGWHDPEDGWRWTDGNAALAVQGPGLLQITLAGAVRYRLAA